MSHIEYHVNELANIMPDIKNTIHRFENGVSYIKDYINEINNLIFYI